jgi:N-methylhydantoinase A
MSYELSADVGGTFTDLVLRTDGVAIDISKASTTPQNISDGVMAGVGMIATRLGVSVSTFMGQCTRFSIGTTIATNAILEGKQAKTGLICTEGFRDTLLIREGGKPDSYAFNVDYPPPYVPRYLTIGVTERVNAEGAVETPLSDEAACAAIAQLCEYRVEAIAVALIWSIINPAHELRIAKLIEREMPGLPYSLSHQVTPSMRDYRRT